MNDSKDKATFTRGFQIATLGVICLGSLLRPGQPNGLFLGILGAVLVIYGVWLCHYSYPR